MGSETDSTDETVRQEGKSLYATQGLTHVHVNGYAAILATPWPSVMLGISVGIVLTGGNFSLGYRAKPHHPVTSLGHFVRIGLLR